MQHSHVRRGTSLIATAFAIVLAGCGDDGTGPNNGNGNGNGNGDDPVTTTNVTITATQSFDPEDIRVSPGATVTWTWAPDNEFHNVIFGDPSITDSGDQDSGTFSTDMPTTPGTYTYLCQFHAGMDGSVLVE